MLIIESLWNLPSISFPRRTPPLKKFNSVVLRKIFRSKVLLKSSQSLNLRPSKCTTALTLKPSWFKSWRQSEPIIGHSYRRSHQIAIAQIRWSSITILDTLKIHSKERHSQNAWKVALKLCWTTAPFLMSSGISPVVLQANCNIFTKIKYRTACIQIKKLLST